MNTEQFDKNIDCIAREAAENYSFPFTENDWKNMELLLNKKEKKKRPIVWWSFAAILIVAGFTYWNFKKNVKQNIIIANEYTKVEEKPTLSSSTTSTEHSSIEQTNTYKKINSINLLSTSKRKQIVQQKNSNNYVLPIKQKNIVINNQSNQFLGNTKTENTDNEFFDSYLKYQFAKNIFNDKETAPTNNQEALLSKFVFSKTVNTPKDNQINKKSILSKLDIGLFAGADVTFANIKSANKLSGNASILFTYPITKKISISSGFGVANKIYTADTNNYKDAILPNSRYKITGIDATCLVYEIPLNVVYQLKQNNLSSWYAVGGLSTYLMKKEVYDYTYSYYGTNKITSYEITNQNKHYLSILSLAIAYRKQLNKTLSYQVMPFAKIPLTGIGNGKINLYSLGLGLSIHYKK